MIATQLGPQSCTTLDYAVSVVHGALVIDAKLSRLAVLIPAWQPEVNLIELVTALSELPFGLILIVDDGSGPGSRPIFDLLKQSNIRLLQHAVNLGKGRALKTGFNCLLTEYPEIEGVVTADADGQHTPSDILRVAEGLLSSKGLLVLGTRSFAKNVPFRSRFGNLLTRSIFGFVTGTMLQDTQSGLRSFHISVLPKLMTLDGERYEYETTVLAHLCRMGKRPVEISVQTIYLNNNRSSHFNPVRDSMRVYFVLARFYLSSLLAAGIDMAGFASAFLVTHNLLVSVAVGRLSSLLNFALNRRFVFHNRGSAITALWRYYALVFILSGVSYTLIRTLTRSLSWNVFAAKFCIDIVLSIVSFSVQRTFVFQRSETQ